MRKLLPLLYILLPAFALAQTYDSTGRQKVNVETGAVVATQSTGTNLHVVVDTAPTTAVTGTFWQTTQPISISQTTTNNDVDVATIAAGDNNIGNVDVLTVPTSGVEDVGETAGGNLDMVGTVRRDTAASSSGASGDNSTLNTDANGLLWTRNGDPCSSGTKTPATFSIATATTTQLVAASASNKVYVCSINLVTAAANNIALVEDDTAACASPTAGMAGGTTAATGWNFAANGGMAFGNGNGSVFQTAATNRYVCLMTSAATQLSGSIQYVLAP